MYLLQIHFISNNTNLSIYYWSGTSHISTYACTYSIKYWTSIAGTYVYTTCLQGLQWGIQYEAEELLTFHQKPKEGGYHQILVPLVPWQQDKPHSSRLLITTSVVSIDSHNILLWLWLCPLLVYCPCWCCLLPWKWGTCTSVYMALIQSHSW